MLRAMNGPSLRPARTADLHLASVWLAILLGAALRLHGLGEVPAGLNSDEASTGVEALSISATASGSG